jgi:hypothetical protein
MTAGSGSSSLAPPVFYRDRAPKQKRLSVSFAARSPRECVLSLAMPDKNDAALRMLTIGDTHHRSVE